MATLTKQFLTPFFSSSLFSIVKHRLSLKEKARGRSVARKQSHLHVVHGDDDGDVRKDAREGAQHHEKVKTIVKKSVCEVGDARQDPASDEEKHCVECFRCDLYVSFLAVEVVAQD